MTGFLENGPNICDARRDGIVEFAGLGCVGLVGGLLKEVKGIVVGTEGFWFEDGELCHDGCRGCEE